MKKLIIATACLLVGCGITVVTTPEGEMVKELGSNKGERFMLYDDKYTDIYKIQDGEVVCYVVDVYRGVGISCLPQTLNPLNK